MTMVLAYGSPQVQFHGDFSEILIVGGNFLKAKTSIKGERTYLLWAGLKLEPLVTPVAGKSVEPTEQRIANPLTLIFGQEPHPFEFRCFRIQLSNGPRTDELIAAERGKKETPVLKIVGSNVIQVCKFTRGFEMADALFERTIPAEDAIGYCQDHAPSVRAFALMDGTNRNHEFIGVRDADQV